MQALTPRERCCRFVIASPSGPLSRLGKGGGGKGQMRCGYLGSVSVRSTDLDFSWEKNLNSYPAQPATGVLGQRPKRVLLTFARTKVSPRRVGVQIKFSKKLSPPEAIADYYLNNPPPPRRLCGLASLAPAVKRLQTFSRISAGRRLQIILFPRRHMTSGAVIFSIARVFSSTVAVARHRAARAAQTAESSHFTRQFW